MEYKFEKVAGKNLYQVRLNGFFITYAEDKDSKMVDEKLKESGWNSREEYFNYLVKNS